MDFEAMFTKPPILAYAHYTSSMCVCITVIFDLFIII